MENYHYRLIKDGSIGHANKGVWLPREIMFNDDFNLTEKVILSVVKGYQKGDRDCFVSDGYLATICSCHRVTISNTIARLIRKKALHRRYKRVNGVMKRVLWL